jgi:hypothetical protein
MTRIEQHVRDLRRRTKTLVERKNVRRDKLAVDASVSYFWLCRYLAEHEDALNPRVNTLAKLEKCVAELERIQ